MSTTMTVPVTIAPEAWAFIDHVGQREQFDLMLERAKRVVPDSELPTRKIGPVPVAENCGLCIGRRRIGGRAS